MAGCHKKGVVHRKKVVQSAIVSGIIHKSSVHMVNGVHVSVCSHCTFHECIIIELYIIHEKSAEQLVPHAVYRTKVQLHAAC